MDIWWPVGASGTFPANSASKVENRMSKGLAASEARARNYATYMNLD
jgi:hypothetical protein